MKFGVVFLLFAILATAHCKLKHEALLKAIGKFLKSSFEHTTDCVKTSGASEESIAKFWDHEYTGENDQKLKCYLQCNYFKTGIVDEKGKLLIDDLLTKEGVVKQILSHIPHVIDKLRDFCMEPVSPDNCESSYQMTMCSFDYIMKGS